MLFRSSLWHAILSKHYSIRAADWLSEEKLAALEKVALEQMKTGVDRPLWEELYLYVGLYRLRPGGLAALLSKCEAAGLPLHRDGGGVLQALQPNVLYQYVWLSAEDLDTFERLLDRKEASLWRPELSHFLAEERARKR